MSQTSDGEEDTNPEISLILGKEAEKASKMETFDEASEPGNIRMMRSYSPVPSVLSMKTDHSKGDPPNVSKETVPIESRMVRSDSPVPSVLSMMSEHSRDRPPNFSKETEAMESRIRDQPDMLETHSEPQCRKRLRGRICDVCVGGRARAVKFCQTCHSSYCEAHIRDHYTTEPLQVHKLQDITEDMDCQQEEEKWPSVSKASRSTSIFNNSWKQCLHISALVGCVLAILLLFIILAPKKSGRSPAPHDLRIVLLGKTGAGKSATGNTILGRKVFKEGFSPKSVTSKCETHSGEVAGRNVTVMDTPGIFHTSLSSDAIKSEMAESISHLFLLVIRLGRFADEDMATPKWLLENFGEDALRYSMLLFTGGDELETPAEEFLRESSGLQELIHSCGGGYHVFNNKEKSDRTQVTELLEKIEAVLFKMTGYHHANKMIQQAQRKIQTEEERKREQLKRDIRAEEERKRDEAEKEIRAEEERKRIILVILIVFIIWVAVVFANKTVQKIQAEQKSKREEREREVRTEEERKKEEAEREIRTEEERKREEAEREIRTEEERKREEAVRKIRDDALKKRQILEREHREEIEKIKKTGHADDYALKQGQISKAIKSPELLRERSKLQEIFHNITESIQQAMRTLIQQAMRKTQTEEDKVGGGRERDQR